MNKLNKLTKTFGYSLLVSLLIGCSSTSHIVRTTNRSFCGKFHGQYQLYFGQDFRVASVGWPTWYLKRPLNGPETQLSRIPPNGAKMGMTKQSTKEILGEPDESSDYFWWYNIR